MLRRLFILAAVVSLGLPAVRAQEGAASHAAVIQADTLPVLLERLERDPEDIDLLVEICSQYTMRSEFAAIHPYVSRLRRAGAAHDDERALMYADLFSGQSYLLAEGSDSTRIYLDRALIRGRQCEDPVALCRIYNALGIYAVSIETNYFGGIEYLMQTEGVYRQNDLTIERLAERLDTNRTYISRAINQQAGKTFSSYVNSYRIDEAVRRLSDVDDDTPLKALAQMLGYNHLQTFYTSFQSAIGMPPSKYREKLLKLHREHQL